MKNTAGTLVVYQKVTVRLVHSVRQDDCDVVVNGQVNSVVVINVVVDASSETPKEFFRPICTDIKH